MGNGKNKAGAPPPPKETVVKKKSGCLLGILLLVILIALLLFLMKHFKFGLFGDGEGDGGSGSGSGTSVSDTVDDKSLEETVVDVTVLGNEYLYDNGKIELASFIDTVKKMDGKINVHIKDDNAYQDTMQALIDALSKEGITYTTPTAE
ncbi:MAG: hypothetical protein IKI56_10270 [Ruminococcus sp.]|nr:hypothetical protein [Ruminococcus sp.]